MGSSPARGQAPSRDLRQEMRTTYRYLRIGIVLLGILLFTGVGLQIVADGAVLPSVSAYYYTPARGVFVASLSAMGACMIIFRGRSDTEDGLLNMAGYLAFFVAFAPTSRQDAASSTATATFPSDLTAAVVNNSWSILLVGGLGFLVQTALTARVSRRPWYRNPAVILSLVAWLGLLIFFLAGRETYLRYGHYVAALGLFLGIVGVVAVNAIAVARVRADERETPGRQWLNLYTFGFGLMVITIVLMVLVVRPYVNQWVFIVEALLIAQFLAFWLTQTVERWRVPELPQDLRVPG